MFPFDSAAGSAMILFLLVELHIGRFTFKTLIERQTAQFFRLCQEEEVERVRHISVSHHL